MFLGEDSIQESGKAYLLGSDGLLASLVELFNGLLVITQILLATNENDGETAAEM